MPDPRTSPGPARAAIVVATVARSAATPGRWDAIATWPERSLIGTCETEAEASAMAAGYVDGIAEIVREYYAELSAMPTAAIVWH